MSSQYTSVYLMRIRNTDYYKIGISRDVGSRHRCIQSSMPFDVELIRSVEQQEAPSIERMIHAALDAYHVRGEWFACEHETICQVFAACNQIETFDMPAPRDKKATQRIRQTTPEMITEARELHHYFYLPQGRIARLLGMSRGTVNRIVNGKGKFK